MILEPIMKTFENPAVVQLIRSATVKIKIGDAVFLVDPVLSQQGSWPGFPGTINSQTVNPMLPLPMTVEEILADVDVIVLTHTHEDHWDEAARRQIPKDMPIFINTEALAEDVRKAGFTNVMVLKPGMQVKGATLEPTPGQHGTDEIYKHPVLGPLLGKTMGVIFRSAGAPTIYLAGDTIWTDEVTKTLAGAKPDVVILNTGNAMTTEVPESVIMGTRDFMRAYNEAPQAAIVGVHMDAINHCVLKRFDLRAYIRDHQLDPNRALVPDDGEVICFG